MSIRNDGCCVCGRKLFFHLREEGRARRWEYADGGVREGFPGFGCGCGCCRVARRGREGRGGRGGDPGALRLLRR